jgi:hypothetical protein
MMIKKSLAALGCAAAVALPVAILQAQAGAARALNEAATVKADSNLRALPTTSSSILQLLPAGTPLEIICGAYGEPVYDTDAYGSLWLYTTLGGWVHSFLVTPVDVGPCAAGAPGVYDGRTAGGGEYADCAEAIAAGAAPMLIGEPGYAPKLDRDDDGIACEWSEP